jgi:hypothetical protein
MRPDDMTLVREFVARRSEPAFAELVERHIGLVHSAALRQTRDALVLRYFENRPWREVAELMRMTEDAAQKRATRALEKLRGVFAKRGVALGTALIAGAVSANSVQAVPVGLAAQISAGVVAGTAASAATLLTATKIIAMTTAQKVLIGATLTVAVGTCLYQTGRNSRLRSQNQILHQQQASLAEQVQHLQSDLEEASNRMAGLVADNFRLTSNSDQLELLRLRGQVAQMKAAENEPLDTAAKAWLAKISKLKQRVEETPGAKIPEMQYLTDKDWIDVAKDADLTIKGGIRMALSGLRLKAVMNFAPQVEKALGKFAYAHGGQLPEDFSELKPYFDPPVDDAILGRYRMLTNGNLRTIPTSTDVVVDSVVDKDYDCRHFFWAGGYTGDPTWRGGDRNSPEGIAPWQDPEYEERVP